MPIVDLSVSCRWKMRDQLLCVFRYLYTIRNAKKFRGNAPIRMPSASQRIVADYFIESKEFSEPWR